MAEGSPGERTTSEPVTTPPVAGRVLRGIAASPGIVIGKAFVLDAELAVDSEERVSPEHMADEISRFYKSLETVIEELDAAAQLARQESSTVNNILETYALIVRDSTMSESVIKRIEKGTSAEAAVAREFDANKAMMLSARDEILRSRAQDFEVIKERIIGALRNRTLTHASGYDSIVVARSVTPQDMLFFKQTQTLGYVTEIGGIHSHACILARDMGYPAVIGVSKATDRVPQDAVIIVDGYSGTVIIDPDDETLETYKSKQLQAEEYRQRLGALADEPTLTSDGVRIHLLANVDEPEHVDAALMAGGEGVGLVRSEVTLIKLGRYPSTEEQARWYRDIAERSYPHPVTIRAYDVGSDKFRQGIPHHEDNPALGLRGIRFLLYRPDIFEEQICAVLQASENRNIRLMLPMVSSLDELEQARKMISTCQAKLRDAGIPFDENIPVGVMIETPAAALMADTFAKNADFLSIGTNDLAQYALATDRTNELVANLFDALHPAVIRLVRMVVEAANAHGKSVSVCGEMAGHASATEMLIGLGLRELSVSPRLLLDLKQRILNVSLAQCKELDGRLDACTTTQEVYSVLSSANAWRGKDDKVE